MLYVELRQFIRSIGVGTGFLLSTVHVLKRVLPNT